MRNLQRFMEEMGLEKPALQMRTFPGVSRSDMLAFHRKVLWAKKPPSPFEFLNKMDIA